MAELLREGRQNTRDGQHVEALARFEDALAIDASPWRVQCEAAFVAWRAERDEAADAHLELALNGLPPGFVPDDARVPVAMCLFNAGLVREAHGNVEGAREMWEESIRLRPNATVSARLAALPPRVEDTWPWIALPATTPIDAVRDTLRADLRAHGTGGFEANELELDRIVLDVETLGAEPSIVAHRIHGEFSVSEGVQYVEALVVRAGGVEVKALLGQSYSAAMAASSTNLVVRMRMEDVLPGGTPELVVEANEWGGSTGYTECWGSSHHLVICTTDLGALRCLGVTLAEVAVYGDEGSGYDEDVPEVEEEGYCRTPRFEPGRVTFEPCGSPVTDDPPFIEGTHELRALFERADIRWPDTWSPLEPIGS